MSHVTHLICSTCNRCFSPGEIDYTCPECGPVRGTLAVEYDYDAVRRELSREALARNREATHWRYRALLPVERPEFIQPLAVGWTPLYRNDFFRDQLGIGAVWIKDDSRNPTASLKDRASSVGVVKALEKGTTAVTAASTGNAASSLSAFTALAGLPTYIFVPEDAPRAKLVQLLLFGAHVIKVRGTYDDAFELCWQAAEKWGWYNRSTAINPYLGEGKKTAALEICEQLGWQAPDYVFVPVGDGCIFQGMWKGFQDAHRLGWIERLPKMIGVQAEGSAALARAWERGAETAEPVEASTFADSISVGMPRDQVKALRAARESGGAFVRVSDEEIAAALALLARHAGIMAEPAGATGLAGLRKMAEQGRLRASDTAVVMVTGHGLKDIDGVKRAIHREAIVVEKALEDVEEKIAHL